MSTAEIQSVLLQAHNFVVVVEEVFESIGETWMTGRGFFSREAVAFRALMQYRGQEGDEAHER